MNLYQLINPLSDELRIEARARAAAIVVKAVGDKPRRDSFAHNQVSRYPGWFTKLIAALLAVVFIAAAMPSLFRLFTAGRDYFLGGIADNWQAAIVGVSTFLLAEFLIILSTISARVYFVGRARWVFVIPVLMGLTMALVGNWTVVKPHDVFSILEAVIPVATVLFVALIGERLILDSIETRHANEHAYQEALHGWQLATSSPEQHPRYMSALANALKAALVEVNSKGSGATVRREVMSLLTNDHWRALVIRELQFEEWYGESRSTLPEPPPLPERKDKEATRPFGSTVPTAAQDAPVSIPTIELQPVYESLVTGNGNGKH